MGLNCTQGVSAPGQRGTYERESERAHSESVHGEWRGSLRAELCGWVEAGADAIASVRAARGRGGEHGGGRARTCGGRRASCGSTGTEEPFTLSSLGTGRLTGRFPDHHLILS